MMYAIDGNNSLKRVRQFGSRNISDTRVFTESDYFLPVDYVEQFSKEVQAREQRSDDDANTDGPPLPTTLGTEQQSEDQATAEGDPTDGSDAPLSIRGCADNWKAAMADEKKRSWAIFEETGIFAGACRHGIMLWIIDMVRSGELYVKQ